MPTVQVTRAVARAMKKAADIKAANLEFSKLSKPEKRVAIARDVLSQMKSERLIASSSGEWLADTVLSPTAPPSIQEGRIDFSVELQEVFKNTESCTVCALGGLFKCAVEKADRFKVNDLFGNLCTPEESTNTSEIEGAVQPGILESYLGKFFSKAQIRSIECHFERNNGYFPDDRVDYDNYGYGDFSNAKNAFCPAETDPQERLRLIMENIVVNAGTFVPSQQPVRKVVQRVACYTTLGFKK